MFLIAHNQVIKPKRYFNDIVPRVEELSNTVGGVFLNKLILDEENNPIELDQAKLLDKPLIRIVIMHFEDKEMFHRFWEAKERHDLWMCGKNYAYFCDTIMESGKVESENLIRPLSEKETEIEILSKHGFTEREAEVMYWLCQGKNNGDIAYILNLSLGTVKKHISNIYDNMGIRNRSSAVAVALEIIDAYKSRLHLVF